MLCGAAVLKIKMKTMNEYKCEIEMYGQTFTDYLIAETASKARYSFYKTLTSEGEFKDFVNHISVKKIGKYMLSKTKEQLEKEVNDFNAKYKVGDRVNVLLDGGETIKATVKHNATILGGHTSVGWFNEISGCYNLDRVSDTNTVGV